MASVQKKVVTGGNVELGLGGITVQGGDNGVISGEVEEFDKVGSEERVAVIQFDFVLQLIIEDLFYSSDIIYGFYFYSWSREGLAGLPEPDNVVFYEVWLSVKGESGALGVL